MTGRSMISVKIRGVAQFAKNMGRPGRGALFLSLLVAQTLLQPHTARAGDWGFDFTRGIVKHEIPDDFRFLAEKSLGRFVTARSDSAHSFDVLSYRIDLDFPMISDYFSGSVAIGFQIVEDTLSAVWLNMAGLVADSVFLGNLPAAYSRDDTSISIDFGAPHSSPETMAVRIYYHDNTAGLGYYHYDRNSYTMSEPRDARCWFPCYDEPWDKATAEIIATVPEEYEVGSNGYLAEVIHDQANHTRTYHWISNFPIATYLINLIMGDYATWNDFYVTGDGDSIPVFNMVWREDSSLAAYDFGNVPEMMRIFSQLFYPYPFEKYGQGTVSPFRHGGMEHQTMTTLNRGWITGDRGAELGYAHELAHMWWGDLVTMADWRHIWLNEGFASYASALINNELNGPESFRLHMLDYQESYFNYDENAGRYPLFDPPELFGLPVYIKGAWVLHMLRGVMGDTNFFAGLQLYAAAYAYSNASTADFRLAMEDAFGSNLDWFFDEWIYGQGYPEYRYSWDCWAEGDSYAVSLDIAQVQTSTPVFRMPLTIRLGAGVTKDYLIENSQSIQRYILYADFQPTELEFDPDNWVLEKSERVAGIDQPGQPVLPFDILIENIYPNPFNNSVSIRFIVAGIQRHVELSIFSVEGRLVKNLISGLLQPARYSVIWSGQDGSANRVSSGLYFVRLSEGSRAQVRKVTYIR